MQEQPIHWETDGTSRIPFAVYTDDDLHKKELERLFTSRIGATSGWTQRSPTRVTSSAPLSASGRSS